LAAGAYFYRLSVIDETSLTGNAQTGSFHQTRKLILAK
jgi:hypothetical protein